MKITNSKANIGFIILKYILNNNKQHEKYNIETKR